MCTVKVISYKYKYGINRKLLTCWLGASAAHRRTWAAFRRNCSLTRLGQKCGAPSCSQRTVGKITSNLLDSPVITSLFWLITSHLNSKLVVLLWSEKSPTTWLTAILGLKVFLKTLKCHLQRPASPSPTAHAALIEIVPDHSEPTPLVNSKPMPFSRCRNSASQVLPAPTWSTGLATSAFEAVTTVVLILVAPEKKAGTIHSEEIHWSTSLFGSFR